MTEGEPSKRTRSRSPPLCAPPRHREQTGVWTRCAVPASPLGLSGSEEAESRCPGPASLTAEFDRVRDREKGRSRQNPISSGVQAQGKPVAMSPNRTVLLGLPRPRHQGAGRLVTAVPRGGQ